jgi:flagellin
MLQRMRVLAVQSANDTNTATERAFANNELNQLQLEISRVSLNTRYNGAQVLNGSFSGKSLQVGTESGESISFSIANIESSKLGAFVEEGLAKGAILGNTPPLNGTSANDLTIAGKKSQIIDVELNDTAQEVAKKINAVAGGTQVTAEARTFAHLYTTAAAPSGDQINRRISFTDSAGNATATAAFTLTSNDVSDAVQKINAISTTTGVQASATSDNKVLLTKQNGDDIRVTNTSASAGDSAIKIRTVGIDGVAEAGSIIALAAAGSANDAVTVKGNIRLTSDYDFTVTDHSTPNFFTAGAKAATLLDISSVDVLTRITSTDALAVIDGAIATVSSYRGGLGTLENRLDYTVSNLMKVTEYTTGARSRVADADFAAETSKLAKAQVLQQAAASMLSQANASTDTVLQLLRG